MAIERINIYNNTSIIQDEVLAHRIGLIPIMVDPDQFKFIHGISAIYLHTILSTVQSFLGNILVFTESDGSSAENTIAFVLDVTCSRRPNVPDSALPSEKYINSNGTFFIF